MIKKTWGPNFEIFTFVLHPSVGPDASNLPSQPSDASSAAEAALAAVTYKSPQNQDTLWNIFKSYNWDAVRSREVQHFWGLLSILTPLDLSTVPPTKVFDFFPQTYECDRNYFRYVGGLPFEEDTTYVCTEKLNITEGSGCTILSAGSRGLGSWETDLLEMTKGNCEIHTFDCTRDHQALLKNVTFHKWCIGNDEVVKDRTFKSWTTTLSEIGLTQVDYLKVAIDGWEWNLIPDILSNVNQVLPLQIAVEFNTGLQPADVTIPHFVRNKTENGGSYDNVTPMLRMMQSLYAKGYHVAARNNRFDGNAVYTFVLDTEARELIGSARLQKRDENREWYKTAFMQKITSPDWSVKWTQLATNFMENVLSNLTSGLMLDAQHLVYSVGIPETYECDRNYLRHITPGQDGYWICTEFLQSPFCRDDIKIFDNIWCKEFFTPKKDCVILSIGSKGEWEFEENMIQLTQGECRIYTLDCTGSWTPPNQLITFKQWCLGNDEIIEGRRYKSWDNILFSLGIRHVDYLKVDMEGWEWVILPKILEKATFLPSMISAKIHIGLQQQGTLPAFKPVETKNGKDHMKPVLNLFKLFYESQFQTASRTSCGLDCEIFTMVKPSRQINNGLGILESDSSDKQHEWSAKPTMQSLSSASIVSIVEEVLEKNWNQEHKAEVLEFWDFASQLPDTYAAQVTNKQIFNVFPISYECESTWFRVIGGDPKSPGSHWACVDKLRSASNCNIVSIGATPTFQWELDLLEYNANCHIHTLDCEMDLIPPHPNIKFHKICIGLKDEDVDGKEYLTWASAISVMEIGKIEYLRMNLKGLEWSVLPQILPAKEKSVATGIPRQISVVMNLNSVSRPPEYTPKTTPYGKDELHPMLTIFKLFYSHGFHIIAKKLNDCAEHTCQEFTIAMF
ncbi:hypothetical protein HDU79_007387 [Rhizoclosmatium sp. JEL0117]|nr:hypothetical protein HDU79_007387 [Rhizoclosmatium sp. JEL0117]